MTPDRALQDDRRLGASVSASGGASMGVRFRELRCEARARRAARMEVRPRFKPFYHPAHGGRRGRARADGVLAVGAQHLGAGRGVGPGPKGGKQEKEQLVLPRALCTTTHLVKLNALQPLWPPCPVVGWTRRRNGGWAGAVSFAVCCAGWARLTVPGRSI